MARIAFILLCHKDPEGIIAQAERLTATGDFISIHFDRRARPEDYRRIRDALDPNPRVTFARRRVRCGWGEWSLVAATLNALRAACEAFPAATHFYMLSGDCMQIKSARFAHAFLDRESVDYIESFDFFESDWIKTGFKEERLIYRHWFNERKRKGLFYFSYEVQRRLGLTRAVPADIEMRIGSQWWCLRRETVEKLLDFIRQRRDIVRFFSTTWIPDETFFQTLVFHLVPEVEIRARTLTFLMFTDYGMPLTFYNDHYDLLLAQDYLFARKISPEARALKDRLGALWAADTEDFPISNEGRNLFTFLTGRGRIGRRFAPRFWETESSLGRERELLIVVCKKWHVAKRLVERIHQVTGIPGVEYLFNEDSCPLPDLGGIQTRMDKRHRHRRALMRMLFDLSGTERLVICLDPGSFELLEDFAADKAEVRILEVECDFSEEYLVGHARRVGLAGESTPPEVIARLLPTIRYDMRFETDRILDAGFAHLARMRQGADVAENARALMNFLGIEADPARQIAETDYLFVD
ncbi:DUF5928 domain-containing protein [Phaeovulum vinaykumarii]|uniref:Peptide O-xylosyltransferase n=1 Tax=Phaeovulum vinaykumarii TaxID=407234 RepID=A0A1N7KAM1_9RHOB|nr:DUF5928 domain-containing protein [Phaeovulum vinaykumarii]SIS58550.1 Core-2/I-Branching enzyme [Phaeovulum vinaykumarii]SOB93835.1 core-2/I-Branching enzyme [Phaeovulum vinaykumarii]